MSRYGATSWVWYGGKRKSDLKFSWSDGTTFGWTKWDGGQPDNSKGVENCIHRWAINGGWNDVSCDNTDHYTCKLDLGIHL